jgi:hypothetical protein
VARIPTHERGKAAMEAGHVITHTAKTVGRGTGPEAREVCYRAKIAATHSAKGIKISPEKTGEGVKGMVAKCLRGSLPGV